MPFVTTEHAHVRPTTSVTRTPAADQSAPWTPTAPVTAPVVTNAVWTRAPAPVAPAPCVTSSTTSLRAHALLAPAETPSSLAEKFSKPVSTKPKQIFEWPAYYSRLHLLNDERLKNAKDQNLVGIYDYMLPKKLGHFSIGSHRFIVSTLFDLIRCVIVGVFKNLL